ncbi:MAG TPA: hypothetical protein VLF59_02785 [Candidatus Saccharimonadales bacterium]|nr:hypothetical protein [Candidatus Saccharimonadales bacterium]
MLHLFIYTLAFLIIGLWLGLKVLRFRLFPQEFLYILSIASSLLIFYALFFVYLASPDTGHELTIAFIAYSPLALWSLIQTVRRQPAQLKFIRNYFLPPLAITAVVFFMYSGLLYGCRYGVGTFDPRRPANNTFCSIREFPLDNGLPEMYGAFVLKHEPKDLVIDWSIADRPPLQIGATIPVQDLNPTAQPSTISNFYNLFSIFLQLSWIGVVWAIFQRFKIRRRYQVVLFVGFCATGFFYLNSVFVWPKLLAAALTVAGMAPFIGTPLTRKLLRFLPVGLGLIALGLEAHGGVIFTIIPFACFLVYKFLKLGPIDRSDYKPIIAAIIILLAIMVPWQAYSSSITTSNRLVKYQFANVTEASDKRGTIKTLIDAYTNLTPGEWAHNKLQNLRTLIDGTGNEGFIYICPIDHVVASRDECAKQRDLAFFSTLFSIESFVFGTIFLIYQAVKRQLDKFDKEALIIISAYLILWVLLMFAPGSTVVHQGSYATEILMFLLAGRAIYRSSPRFLSILVAAQLIIFYAAWIHPFPYFS